MPERLIIEQEKDWMLMRQHVARYRFASQFVQDKMVLDVACGSGYGSAILLEHGARSVIGLDSSREAIEFAARQYAKPGLEYIVGDAHDLSSFTNIDVLVSFETIEHLAKPRQFLRSVSSCLHWSGASLISTPIRQSGTLQDKPVNPYHLEEWNAEEFTDLLSGFFSNIDIRYQYSFGKLWYPWSRTISRQIARVLHPEQLQKFLEFSVGTLLAKLSGVPVRREYMIALCSGLKP